MNVDKLRYLKLGSFILNGIFLSPAWGVDNPGVDKPIEDPPGQESIRQEADLLSPLIEHLLSEKTDLSLNTGLHDGPTKAASAEPKAAGVEIIDSGHLPAAESIVEGIIVRFKSPEIQALARANLPPPEEVVAKLEAALGEELVFHGAMVNAAHVFRFLVSREGKAIAEPLQRAARLPDIEWIEADIRVKAKAIPNDPFFEQQWNLHGVNQGVVGGIEAIDAWDITHGSADTVVAVVDTGVRPHPEFAARLLPGYDFISDLENANDGDGPDSDASDPGDWRLQDECSDGAASARDSSWHGTHVTGIIAAQGDNGLGVAGVNWNTHILPVRVLGKCDGVSSDILNGMAWAAGLPVPGVPLNPKPAQVINLSFSSESPSGCPPASQAVIDQILGQGALIVVAAGNENEDARYHAPANCEGVLSVAATGYEGDLASYSNWGLTAITIAAPGGDLSWGGSLDHGILSTIVEGTTIPEGFTYAWGVGTSMAAPQAAGIASLALAVNPNLSGSEIYVLLQLASKPFSAGNYCTTNEVCGTGIADASKSVMLANTLKDYRLVYEFYNANLNHYFLTGSKEEAAMITRGGVGPGWANAGNYFYAWSGPEEGALPVCRFYTQGANSHFYTASSKDCAFLRSLNPENVLAPDQWTYEGIAFYARLPTPNGVCPPDSVAIYRLYNNRWRVNDSNHRFVRSLRERNAMIARGWVDEGVAFCVAAAT